MTCPAPTPLGITVRGGASDEELAVVLAVVGRPGAGAVGPRVTDPLSAWRATRLAAVRRGTSPLS